MRIVVDIKREQMASAITKSKYLTQIVEIMTPKEPKESARTCKYTPCMLSLR